MGVKTKNHSDELIFTRKVCVEAPQTLRSHRRIRSLKVRRQKTFKCEILLACLSAQRFDIEVRMEFVQSYYTNKGGHRKSNQDSLAIVKAALQSGETLLALVCDGMGGYSQGELASKYCVTQIVDWYKNRFPAVTRGSANDDWRIGVQTELDILIRNINEHLVAFGRDNELKIGSTLTGIIFWKQMYLVFHVGDSRAYLFTDKLRQITADDSVVAQKVSEGKLTAQEAKYYEKKNVLTNCVGVSSGVSVQYYAGNYYGGECFLLCSDGFWHNLEEAELVRYLQPEQIRTDSDMSMHLEYLTNLVYERGERDNSTAVGVKIQ